MTTFIGTNSGDTIVPGLISPGIIAIGADATPGDGDDFIIARGGDDIVAGGKGSDIAALGSGDDTFGWAPADGSDIVFGQAGFDRLVFDGDGADETFVFTTAGGEARLDRDVGDVTMRLASIERIDLFAGGGSDAVAIDDMTGSGVQEVRIDLSGSKGSGIGDGALDRVTLTDRGGDSFVTLSGAGSTLSVLGLPTFVELQAVDTGDEFVYRAGSGDDFIGAGSVGDIRLLLDGGNGDDFISSGAGDDLLRGGRGSDFVIGGKGDDTADLGTGDDIFAWANGDGSDVVEGGRGRDSLRFDGFAADEAFELSAAGGRALLTRDLGDIRMDLNHVETVTIRTQGGADLVAIGDLTGTDVTSIEIAMSLPGRAGDDAADSVSLAGGAKGETIDIASGGGSLVTVNGLPASVDVFGVEAIDTLIVSGGDGDDIIRAQDVQADQAHLTLDGGTGDDFLFGSDGADLILGGDGDDRITGGGGDDDVFGARGDEIAILGAGDDRFSWDPGEGNDAVVGGDGLDTLDFDGSGSNEEISVTADGGDAVLLRDVGAVRMDLNGVERIDLHLFGGTDMVTVSDVGDTDLDDVVIDLSGPDGAADFVVVEGSEAADDVTIGVDGDAIVVSGLSATIRIVGAEDGLDQFLFRGFGGDDRIDASALSGIALFVQGGAGDDVIFGSAFGDTLSGDDGDDVIIAGSGSDTAFGGPGDDVLDGGPGFDMLSGGEGDDVLLNGEIISDPDAGAFLF